MKTMAFGETPPWTRFPSGSRIGKKQVLSLRRFLIPGLYYWVATVACTLSDEVARGIGPTGADFKKLLGYGKHHWVPYTHIHKTLTRICALGSSPFTRTPLLDFFAYFYSCLFQISSTLVGKIPRLFLTSRKLHWKSLVVHLVYTPRLDGAIGCISPLLPVGGSPWLVFQIRLVSHNFHSPHDALPLFSHFFGDRLDISR